MFLSFGSTYSRASAGQRAPALICARSSQLEPAFGLRKTCASYCVKGLPIGGHFELRDVVDVRNPIDGAERDAAVRAHDQCGCAAGDEVDAILIRRVDIDVGRRVEEIGLQRLPVGALVDGAVEAPSEIMKTVAGAERL